MPYLAAQKILQLGPKAVIVKGGHLDCTDLLVEGDEVILLPGERVKGENHGVGCTYSAALTSFLALGSSLKEAARQAKKFAEKALLGSMRVGKGVGPVNQAAYLRQEANRYRVLVIWEKGREDINWWGKDAQRIVLAGVLIMGSVKPSYIKNFAMDLLRTYESSFSPDFEQNKLKVSEYTDIKNKTIRNRVAGYISNVMRQRRTRRGEVEIDA